MGLTMAKDNIEIIVEDPTAPAANSPPVTSMRTADAATMLLLMGFSLVMAYDNWQTGIAWAPDGPEPGYFPFYLAVIMLLASLYGLIMPMLAARGGSKEGDEAFVTRDQLRRVLMVFVPTVAFCVATQWLGLYVASFLLVSGFMWWIGKIKPWKSVLTALIFSVAMFCTFQIAFDVIMPKGPLEALLGY